MTLRLVLGMLVRDICLFTLEEEPPLMPGYSVSQGVFPDETQLELPGMGFVMRFQQ